MATVTKAHRFTINVERVDDDNPDLSHLGEYTNTPTFPFYDRQEGVVVHNDQEWEALGDRSGRSCEYRYIHEFQSTEDDKYIIQDARRLEDYGNGWCAQGVRVTASLDGKEWGEASLWGIDSDSGDCEFAHINADLEAEALEMAEKELAAFLAKHCTH